MQTVVFDIDKRGRSILIADEHLDILRAHFSVENKGASIGRYKKYGNQMQIRKYAITGTGVFKIGLYPVIIAFLQSNSIPFILTDAFKKKCRPQYRFKKKIKQLKLKLYDHQEEAIQNCLNQGCGVIEVGTGGGKTLLTATLINTIMFYSHSEHKTLILVPSLQLVEQTYTDFISYGIDEKIICKYSGKNLLDPNSKIIIAGTQILNSKTRDNTWIYFVDLLIVDECHGIKYDNKITEIIEMIQTPHKFGFTGTLPEDKIDVWTVFGILGPLLYTVKSYELREKNILSAVIICLLTLIHKTFPNYNKIKELGKLRAEIPPQLKWEIENNFLYTKEWRNSVICSICKNVNDKNILIMVDRIMYGQILSEYLTSRLLDKKIYFIQGSIDVNIREEIRRLMEAENNIICIAVSKIFSTGINIKNLPCIIFTIAGKAKVKIIQSIGRGLRKHENKDKLIIFDLADNLEYSRRHIEQRMKLYKQEQLEYIEKEICEK
jgi:superfamily II DNA or RNA helicase